MTDIEIPEGFTRWDGRGADDDGPVFIRIEILYRNGEKIIAKDPGAYSWSWFKEENEDDIIGYRIVSDA